MKLDSHLLTVPLLVAAALAAWPAQAQVGSSGAPRAAAQGAGAPPAFSRYPASVERIAVRQPRLQGKAATFKTRLREALSQAQARGPSFGGRFVVASWGCGSDCVQAVFIDGRTGEVHFPDQLAGATPGYGELENKETLEYRADSNLFIVNGTPADDERYGVWAYEWTGRSLKLVSYTKKRGQATP